MNYDVMNVMNHVGFIFYVCYEDCFILYVMNSVLVIQRTMLLD